jgi:methylmalonyl-CoA/ethylmalonyl-CoA epimerase
MNKVDHIGIAVKDLSVSIPLFEKLLNTACYKRESVESEHVETAFFKIGDTKIELLQDVNDGNTISKFIERRGEGIHHIAFEVGDIHAEIDRLKKEGISLISDSPKPGADRKNICFIHPKDTHGVLIELCMDSDLPFRGES